MINKNSIIAIFCFISFISYASANNNVLMEGRFTGTIAPLLFDKKIVNNFLPSYLKNNNTFLRTPYDLTKNENKHLVFILLGTQKNVGAKVFLKRKVRHPKSMGFYNECIIVIPYIYLNNKGPFLVFSKIFLDNEKVIKRAKRINNSPKYFANINNTNENYQIIVNNQIILNSYMSAPYSFYDEEIFLALKNAFNQIKIEYFDGNFHYYKLFFFNKTIKILSQSLEISFNNYFLPPSYAAVISGLNKDGLGGFWISSNWQKIKN